MKDLELIDVHGATLTAREGFIDVHLTLVGGLNGDGETPMEVDFTWDRSDPYLLSPQVTAWFEAHPEFPVGPYVAPPPPDPEVEKQTIIERVAADLALLRALGVSL